jgi:hypothetical protein
MSGISNIGKYYSDLNNQQLQQALSQQNAATAASQATSTAAATTPSTDSAGSSVSTSLKDKIRTAIMSAVHEAEASGYSTDFLTVIRDAVNKTLKDAGIDPNTAENNNNVDSSTKTLLTVLDQQAKIEAKSASLLAELANLGDSTTSTDPMLSLMGTASGSASAAADPLAVLNSLSGNNATNQNLAGYLLDTQQ